MKTRPEGFLSEEKIPHDSEIFDYIKELHDILWRFVRIVFPGASGNLSDYITTSLVSLEEKTDRLGRLANVASNLDDDQLQDVIQYAAYLKYRRSILNMATEMRNQEPTK